LNLGEIRPACGSGPVARHYAAVAALARDATLRGDIARSAPLPGDARAAAQPGSTGLRRPDGI
jgi:hypothetical protein